MRRLKIFESVVVIKYLIVFILMAASWQPSLDLEHWCQQTWIIKLVNSTTRRTQKKVGWGRGCSMCWQQYMKTHFSFVAKTGVMRKVKMMIENCSANFIIACTFCGVKHHFVNNFMGHIWWGEREVLPDSWEWCCHQFQHRQYPWEPRQILEQRGLTDDTRYHSEKKFH